MILGCNPFVLGAVWVVHESVPGEDVLMMEDGTALLLESGEAVLLE